MHKLRNTFSDDDVKTHLNTSNSKQLFKSFKQSKKDDLFEDLDSQPEEGNDEIGAETSDNLQEI
jgi:hypothetical protein